MPNELKIEGRTYQFVGGQKSGAAVYRGRGRFLRIGPPAAIKRDLAFHKKMEANGYPVAKFLSEGELSDHYYFTEKAFVGSSFRNHFAKEYTLHREVSSQTMSTMSKIARRLFSAQAESLSGIWTQEDLAAGIRLEGLCAELPQHAHLLQRRFGDAARRLKDFPAVITHGDCNPSNLYNGGIIDLEDSFVGPVGFDIASIISTNDWFPRSNEYEFVAQFAFSDGQKKVYIHRFDKEFKKYGLPPLSQSYDDFAFCRAVWLCAGMGPWPRIQQWRFEKLVKEYLS